MEAVLSQNLKGYELRERIGAGGFGAVYRAYQTTVGREVAVKIILPVLANQPEFIRRFEGEAQIVARLADPHPPKIAVCTNRFKDDGVIDLIDPHTGKRRIGQSAE